MPSVGRKFLLAGRGGLNLTHSEPFEPFAARFGERRAQLEPLLARLRARRRCATGRRAWASPPSSAPRAACFPTDMKAAPLLRAWLHRLRAAGVRFHMRHRWRGWPERSGADRAALRHAGRRSARDGRCHRAGAGRRQLVAAGLRRRLGAAGCEQRGVDVAPLAPANCGFDVRRAGARYFAERFAGTAVQVGRHVFADARGRRFARKGEFVATATGVEGSLVYAASALLRDEIAAQGSATLLLDLLPDRSAEQVLRRRAHPRGARSLASHLKSRLGLEGIKTGAAARGAHARADARARRSWPRRSRRCRCALVRATADRRGDQHAPAACASRRSMRTDAARRCPACSAPARCSTGKRRPAATC